jgi:hypothetical protein
MLANGSNNVAEVVVENLNLYLDSLNAGGAKPAPFLTRFAAYLAS